MHNLTEISVRVCKNVFKPFFFQEVLHEGKSTKSAKMPNVPERSELEDLLHCMICFESYQNPKMLTCGHTFCSECLVGYFQTYQQQRRAVQGIPFLPNS